MGSRMRDRALDQAIERMPDEHVQCRDYGHAWAPLWAQWDEASKSFDTGLRCQRCRTIRRRTLDRHGAQVSHSYDYPDGYLIAGIGRLTGADRDHLRLASVLGAMAHGTATKAVAS